MKHRSKYPGVCALTILLVSLSGCAGPDPFDDWSDTDLAERVESLSRSDPWVAANTWEESGDTDDLPHEAGLSWYTATAFRDNPEVRAARQRVERLREREPQATALPDPMATFTFGELAQTAAGQVDYIVGVQQSLPYPGTLDARGEVARQEVVASLHALQGVIDRVVGDVRRAYWSYDGASREIEVLEQSRLLLIQIESAVQARVRVGKAGQADLLRISREVAALENRISEWIRRQQTASAMLGRITSRRAPAAWPRTEINEWTDSAFDSEALRRLATQNNPGVAEAQARVQTYRQRLELARQERKPDFVVGFQYGEVRAGGLAPGANGDDQIAGTVGVTIPFGSGRYDASEREAMRGMGEALAEVHAAQDRVVYEVEVALARIESSEQSLRRLQERMMPDARQTIEVALSSYRTGDVDFIQMLDDWQVLLGDQLEEARLIADLQKALADLEQAVGGIVAENSIESESEHNQSGDS